MEASDEVRLALHSTPLPHLGQALGAVVTAFEARPLLGVVLVDASPIGMVEGAHGHGARAAIMLQLGALVREVAQQLLGADALVVAGETGRLEVMVLTFREGRDGRFYRDDLPNLVRALDHAIEKRGHRIVYPYAQEDAGPRRGLRRAGAKPVPRRRHADPLGGRGGARRRRAQAQDAGARAAPRS